MVSDELGRGAERRYCYLRAALDAGSDPDIDGWKRIWSMLFELRDLK
jgi:hypothetical protein